MPINVTDNIPDTISFKELKLLKQQATAGKTQLDIKEFKAKANAALQMLKELSIELDSCQTNEVTLDRWQSFTKARRSIKSAIRNIQKSIST